MKKKISFLLLISILIFTIKVNAQKGGVQQLGQNYYVAGINSSAFEYFAVARQHNTNWCWAACIQMVLNYHGMVVTQEEIVTRCYGGLVNNPGGDREMFNALSGWGYNAYGRTLYIYANNYPTNPTEIQNYLATGNPLIVGLNQPNSNIGHAYVLTALYYSYNQDYYGNIYLVPIKVVLRNPWPYSPSREEMSWYEFVQRLNSCWKVIVRDF